jgi:hypothetical protein
VLHIHYFSWLALMLRRIVELKVGLRVPRAGEGAELLSIGEKVVHALFSVSFLIYFKNF